MSRMMTAQQQYAEDFTYGVPRTQQRPDPAEWTGQPLRWWAVLLVLAVLLSAGTITACLVFWPVWTIAVLAAMAALIFALCAERRAE